MAQGAPIPGGGVHRACGVAGGHHLALLLPPLGPGRGSQGPALFRGQPRRQSARGPTTVFAIGYTAAIALAVTLIVRSVS